MAEKERSEDLNPRGKEIEEKVRRMMDPSVPDEAPKVKSKKDKSESKVRQINIDDQNSTTQDVAAELNKTIAELDNTQTPPEPTTAPELGKTSSSTEVAAVPSSTETDLAVHTDTAQASTPPGDPLDSPENNKAVDEIASAESDEILEVEDAILATEETNDDQPKTSSKLGQKIRKLFGSKRFRRTLLAVVFAGAIVALSVPTSRYFLLNTAGVRASSSVVVLDNSTGLPLKNVSVTLGETNIKTDDQGTARFSKMRLGPTNLKVEKLAFAGIEKSVTLGWGSNPLGEHKLTPTGEQYDFTVTDFLSGKAVVKAEATSGEASAFSDDQGNIKLTLAPTDEEKITVKIYAKEARTETITFDASDQKPKSIKMVPGRKHAFISKRSGKYDIYNVYIDGKEEKLVLAGSGHERDDMVLVPHPTSNILAYVSTRANQKNEDGYVLSNLILINPGEKDTTNITAAEKIQVLGWAGDYLIFVKTRSGESAADPKRSQLLSYNMQDNSTKELATSNYFNDVLLAKGVVYMAPSGAYAGGTAAQLYSVNPDGTSQTTLLNQEVWSIIRADFNTLALSARKYWYDYLLGSDETTRLDSPPASQKGRNYLDSANGSNSVWIDQRDGKGTLLNYSVESKKDQTLLSKRGITYPVSWLSDRVIVYRLNDDSGTADYAVSLDGGDPVKIGDVTHIDTTDDWYYY